MKSPTRVSMNRPVARTPSFAAPAAAAPTAYSYLRIERRGSISVVNFNGRAILEENAIRAIGEEIVRLVEKFGTKQIVLNFRDVRNLSSFMLATLVNVYKKIQASGGRMALCGIEPDIMKIFEITSLHKLFKIYPFEADAISSF